MPELPEVESARAAVERAALGRRITEVDDTDSWVCRPHAPGEIRAALLGRTLTGAFRRGKSMWCETSGVGRSRTPGPVLGLHLGMSGHLLITDAGGALDEGGDWLGRRAGRAAERAADKPVWVRFALTFADGGGLRLFDQRRLGRVRLDPAVDALGPDAQQVPPQDFAARMGRRRGPGTARRRAAAAARAPGGAHTAAVTPSPRTGAHGPGGGTEMQRATVGGRTTWWCPREQK